MALLTPLRFLAIDQIGEPPEDDYGPWTICDAANNDVAEVYSVQNAGVPTSREDSIAYARLFAAAPDLLEALVYARRFLKAEDHDVAFVDAAIAAAYLHDQGWESGLHWRNGLDWQWPARLGPGKFVYANQEALDLWLRDRRFYAGLLAQTRIQKAGLDLLEALEGMVRASSAHIFKAHLDLDPEKRDICLQCGEDIRSDVHIRCHEGEPEQVKAAALDKARAAIARARGDSEGSGG